MNEYINTFPFDPCQYPFNIEAAGITNLDYSFVANRTDCYCYILEYIYNGQGIIVCDNKTYYVKAGDAYLLPKGSTHYYFPNDSWDKYWFNIDGTLVSNLICAYGLQDTVVFNDFNEPKLFQDLYEITNMKAETKEIMSSAAIQFHLILQQMHKIANESKLENNIVAIKNMLDLNLYQRDISIGQISQKLSLSQVQIINMFKKTFNVTPYQYFTQKRVELAASLLLTSNMSIKEISETLNYADQPCFTKSFKKIMGCSPVEYRKSKRNTVSNANLNNKLFMENTISSNIKINRK